MMMIYFIKKKQPCSHRLNYVYILKFICNFIHMVGRGAFLCDEGPMLETLDHTIRIGSTPTFL